MGQKMVLAKSQSKQGMPVSPLIPFSIYVAKLLIFPKRDASFGHAAAKVKSTKNRLRLVLVTILRAFNLSRAESNLTTLESVCSNLSNTNTEGKAGS